MFQSYFSKLYPSVSNEREMQKPLLSKNCMDEIDK